MNADNQFLKEFINLYQLFPCLWNTDIEEYSDRKLRKDAYDLLVEKCRERYPDANENFVIKKIFSLRCNFRRELENVIESMKKAGRSADDIYTPKLWYYDILSFIADYETPRNGASKLEGDLNVEDEVILCGEMASLNEINMIIQSPHADRNYSSSAAQTACGTEISRCKRSASEQVAPCTSRRFKKTPSETDTEDEFSVAGKKYASDIKMLSKGQRIIAEKLVSDVFFFANLDKLNEHSTVKLRTPRRRKVSALRRLISAVQPKRIFTTQCAQCSPKGSSK